MVRAVLWDNDGVLVDTERLYFQATRETLAEVGVPLSEEQFLDYSLRRGVAMFDLARERGYGDEDVDRLRRRRNERYSRLLESGVQVNPGVEAALGALRGRYRMAIVTSSRREHFDIIHSQTRLLAFFELVLTPDDYGAHKPHPEPYLTAARRLGVEPRDCVAIEDSPRGVLSASRAGMRCLALPHPLSASDDLALADRVLSSAREVPGAVQALAAATR